VAREALRLAAKGEDPSYLKREKIQLQRQRTFKAVLEEHLERDAKVKNRKWKQKKSYLEAHVLPVWKDMPIDCIKKKDIIALRDKLMDRGKPYAANNVFAAVRRLFNWAAERDYIEFSPCANIGMPATAVERDRVLTNAEIKKISMSVLCDRYSHSSLRRGGDGVCPGRKPKGHRVPSHR